MLQVRDTGNITEEQLYTCISPDGIANLNENDIGTTKKIDGLLLDCDLLVLDFGIIVWFNHYGCGINLTTHNIVDHRVVRVDVESGRRDNYQM